MNKYLGDYNIAKSSSNNIRNIIWTMKNPEKSKNNKINLNKKSSTNIIYGDNPQEKLHVKKVIKIYQEVNIEKSKKNKDNLDHKFENASAENCNIQQGFKRPGR